MHIHEKQIAEIAVLVGSLSQHSLNRRIAHFLAQHAPENLQLNLIGIGDLPLYDRDSDKNPPPQYARIRVQIAAADGTLWISPEHNGGIPAAAAMAGGQRTGDQLRTIGIHMGMPVLHVQTPISRVHEIFNENGEITNESAKNRLLDFIRAYGEFVHAIAQAEKQNA